MEKYIVTTCNVNFRSGAGTSYRIIETLPSGTVVRVLEKVEGVSWYKGRIESDGTEGYITSLTQYTDDYTPEYVFKAMDIASYGDNYLGTPYQWGSSRSTTATFDCSDFVKHIFGHFGYSLGWTSREQATQGTAVASLDSTELKSGDLIFFAQEDGYVYHVAIYMCLNGKDLLLQTFNTTSDVYNRDLIKIRDNTGGVTWSDFSVGSYWRNRADFARRIL